MTFSNWATSLTCWIFNQNFDITIFLLQCLCSSRNFAQRIILLLPFINGVFFFQLLHQWCVCYTFDVHFDFLSLLLSPSSASQSFILASWAFHSLTSNSPAVLGLLIWLPSPPLASQLFLPASHLLSPVHFSHTRSTSGVN